MKKKSNQNATRAALSDLQVYRDYERAFTQGTGLPLRRQGPDMLNLIRFTKAPEHPGRPHPGWPHSAAGRT